MTRYGCLLFLASWVAMALVLVALVNIGEAIVRILAWLHAVVPQSGALPPPGVPVGAPANIAERIGITFGR